MMRDQIAHVNPSEYAAPVMSRSKSRAFDQTYIFRSIRLGIPNEMANIIATQIIERSMVKSSILSEKGSICD